MHTVAPADGTVDLAPGTASAVSWPWRWLVFWCWYAWALVTSSKAVIKDLVTPGVQARSGIARVRSNCRTDAEVTLLSALITLTPGTLTLGTRRAGAVGDEDGDPDARRLLYVHGLYADDADALRLQAREPGKERDRPDGRDRDVHPVIALRLRPFQRQPGLTGTLADKLFDRDGRASRRGPARRPRARRARCGPG